MAKKKYRFRKMYFICTDNKIIAHNVHAVNAWQNRDNAQAIADQMKTTRGMYIIKEVPMVHQVHGYYLVHESLFDEILKEFNKD